MEIIEQGKTDTVKPNKTVKKVKQEKPFVNDDEKVRIILPEKSDNVKENRSNCGRKYSS